MLVSDTKSEVEVENIFGIRHSWELQTMGKRGVGLGVSLLGVSKRSSRAKP